MLNKIKNEIAKSIVAITIFTTTYATKVFAGVTPEESEVNEIASKG